MKTEEEIKKKVDEFMEEPEVPYGTQEDAWDSGYLEALKWVLS